MAQIDPGDNFKFDNERKAAQGTGSIIDTFIEENTSMQDDPLALCRTTTRELLRYEAATQSVMHGLIPSSLAINAHKDEKESYDSESSGNKTI